MSKRTALRYTVTIVFGFICILIALPFLSHYSARTVQYVTWGIMAVAVFIGCVVFDMVFPRGDV